MNRVSAQGEIGESCLADIDVLIIAGGLGTRIAPALGNLPKILAPISGRPYLAYLFDWLTYFGARRIILGLGHKAEIITDYLNKGGVIDRNLAIESVIEPRPLGTAGAIRFARRHLKTDPVLVMNGDSYVDVDVCKFVAYHRQTGTKATLLCVELENTSRYGRVIFDDDGRISGFTEKDQNFSGSGSINAGMYLFSAEFLDAIATGDAVSLEKDVFARAPSGSLGVFNGGFDFIDIGTPESLSAAARFFGERERKR